MLTSGQIYTHVLNKAMEDAQRKENTHIVLEFNRCDTQFLVEELQPPPQSYEFTPQQHYHQDYGYNP